MCFRLDQVEEPDVGSRLPTAISLLLQFKSQTKNIQV